MATSLLSRLQAAFDKNPSPDAIVASITSGGWIRACDISEEQFYRDQKVRYYIGYINNETGEWTMLYGPGQYYHWHLWSDATHSEFVKNFKAGFGITHWIIPASEYIEGELPSCLPNPALD